MIYTVVWSKEALDALAEIWLTLQSSALQSSVRASLNEVVADIDKLLQVAPEEQGESRDEGRRVMFAAPLVVTFRVFEDDRKVQIIFARLMKSAKGP